MTKVPAGWMAAPLEDFATIVLGQSPPGRAYNMEGRGLPFFQGKAEFGPLRPEVRKWTTEAAKIAEADDVLLSVRAPVGPVNLALTRCAIGRGLAALRPVLGDSRYLLYAIRATADTLAAKGTGSTFSAVTGAQVRAHAVPIAPLNEQRRIVATIEEQFSRLDVATAALETARRRADVLRERAVEEALSGDWTWTTLGEIAELAGGITKDAKRQDDPDLVEVPYLRVANVQRGYLDLGSVTTIRALPAKVEALALRPGDVLFNEGGDRDKLGRGWVWSGEIDLCIHQNHVFRARLTAGFEPKFVSLHGNTFGREWFEANGRQTTNLASLNLNTLRRFPVPAPPLDEQRRIVSVIEQRLSVIDGLRNAAESARAHARSLRRSILERAFRGELVPQDASDEPATVLLERIRAERAAQPPTRRTRRRTGVASTS